MIGGMRKRSMRDEKIDELIETLKYVIRDIETGQEGSAINELEGIIEELEHDDKMLKTIMEPSKSNMVN